MNEHIMQFFALPTSRAPSRGVQAVRRDGSEDHRHHPTEGIRLNPQKLTTGEFNES